MTAAADASDAWHFDILAGRGYTDSYSWSTAGFLDVIGPSRPLAYGFAWSPAFSVGAVGGTDKFGPRFDKTVWFAGAGAHVDVWRGLFVRFEVGAVSSRTPAFSSTCQFASSLGWQWQRVTVAVRHISNGGLRGRNFGETMALAGVSF